MSFTKILVSLLGVKAPEAKAAVGARGPRDIQYESPILSVDSLRFVGQAVRSPSKRWILAWTDRLPGVNPRPDRRDGSAVLVDYPADQAVVRLADLCRPMEGDVADDGTFLLNDTTFGGRLSADIRACDVGGRELLRRRFTANVFNLAISRCGGYGVVQTANSSSGDGNLLELYDVRAGTRLFSRAPETGWADRYVFNINDAGDLTRLTVVHDNLGRFDYSPDGEFLKKGAYRKARLNNGSAESRVHGAKDALRADPANPDVATEVLATLEAALLGLHEQRTDCLALGLRLKGEALEMLGRKTEAMAAYEQALAIDPKIGVAKRLASLRKTLG